MNLWYFSKDEDPDARPYEPADARSVQPDHYPNVMRPGGGYPEGQGEKTDAFCNSCDDQLVDGSCLRCNWGPQSRSEPINNFPIDPFEDDKAGIRAASWKFGMPVPHNQTEEYKAAILEKYRDELEPLIIKQYEDQGYWSVQGDSKYSQYQKIINDFLKEKEDAPGSAIGHSLVKKFIEPIKAKVTVSPRDQQIEALNKFKNELINILAEVYKSTGFRWPGKSKTQETTHGIQIFLNPVNQFLESQNLNIKISTRNLTEWLNMYKDEIEDVATADMPLDASDVNRKQRSLMRKKYYESIEPKLVEEMKRIIEINSNIENPLDIEKLNRDEWMFKGAGESTRVNEVKAFKNFINSLIDKYQLNFDPSWTRGKGGYDPSLDGYFYILQSQRAFKIGISNYLESRMKTHEKTYRELEGYNWGEKPYWASESYEGIIPWQTEKRLISWIRSELNIPVPIELEGNDGFTETSLIGDSSVPVELVHKLATILLENGGNPKILNESEKIDLIQNMGEDAIFRFFNNQMGQELGFNLDQDESELAANDGSIPPNIRPEKSAPDAGQPVKLITDEEIHALSQEPSEGAWPDLSSNESQLVPDPTTGELITPEELARRQSKTSNYQGWSNWETWNTKLMIDNEYDLYMQSRRIVEERRPIEQFATWATQAVIAPHNQSALADAQEWNEIPYEERPTGREDMPEGARDLIEGIEGIFGDDPREDATAEIIDESKVNWNEIYNSIGEDIKESEARAHEGGEHELPMEQYTGYTSEELIEAKADQHPWCPLCNPENPDAPGDLTIPDDWTGF